MVAFSHSYHPDISRSTFNDVGRDQTYHIAHQTIHINISDSGTGQTLHRLLWPTSGPWMAQGVLIPKCHSSTVVSVVDIAVGLVVKIIHLLHIEWSDDYRHLERDLKSLCQSLILTRSAIQVYEYTPLGQSLANTVHPKVERCHMVLLETFNKIIHYRESLNSTRISGFWRQVWWNSWDENERALFRMELSACQDPLNEVLMALNSYVLLIFLKIGVH